jgi:hypothetical protein
MIFFILWLIGILAGIITTIFNPSLRTVQTIAYNMLYYQIIITVTFSGLICFIGHVFTNRVAKKNGWSEGNLFEKELGFSQLGWFFAGILSLRYKDSFLIAVVVIFCTMIIGAAIIHIIDKYKNNNLKQGNPIIIIIDLLIPATLIILLILAKIL